MTTVCPWCLDVLERYTKTRDGMHALCWRLSSLQQNTPVAALEAVEQGLGRGDKTLKQAVKAAE